jgi:hypothetical protein
MTSKIKICVALIAALMLSCASQASAGTYKVYSCKLPGGAPAATDGWSDYRQTANSWTANGCASGAGLTGDVFGAVAQPANSSQVAWGFDSGGREIAAWSASISGHNFGGLSPSASPSVWIARPVRGYNGTNLVYDCGVWASCSGFDKTFSESVTPTAMNGLHVTAMCGGVSGYNCAPIAGNLASFVLRSAEFTLVDNVAPTTSGAAGSLTTGAVQSGVESLIFSASDPGPASGIYQAQLEVDGQVVATQTPDLNGGKCVADFQYRQPCPSSTQAELSWNTASAGDGVHTVRARVFDAAGNSATAFGPAALGVSNSGPAGLKAAASARFEPDQAARVVTSYGRRPTVSGRLLTNSGAPISGAAVEISERVAKAGAPQVLAGTVTTDSRGRYSFHPRGTASRALELTHAASGAKTTTAVQVRSRVRLRSAKSHVKPYGRMLLRGRIPSERLARGATVEIQAKARRRWRTVAVRRTNGAGSFKFNYRFKRTAHGSFSFRARVRKTSDLPVEPLVSRAKRVRVG